MNGQIQYDPAPGLTSRTTTPSDPKLTDVELEVEIGRDGMPVVTPRHPLPAGQSCHFTAPARYGRRRTDPCGHLQFTNLHVRFDGTIELAVAWSEIAGVDEIDSQIVLTRTREPRPLRFCCHAPAEAARAAVIARHLTAYSARPA